MKRTVLFEEFVNEAAKPKEVKAVEKLIKAKGEEHFDVKGAWLFNHNTYNDDQEETVQFTWDANNGYDVTDENGRELYVGTDVKAAVKAFKSVTESIVNEAAKPKEVKAVEKLIKAKGEEHFDVEGTWLFNHNTYNDDQEETVQFSWDAENGYDVTDENGRELYVGTDAKAAVKAFKSVTESIVNEAKEYKKGDKVTIQDGKFTKDAVVAKDGIKMHRGDAQVIVRIKGFPMDMGISLDTSKPAYIIENSINEAKDINLKLSRDERDSLVVLLKQALKGKITPINPGDTYDDISRIINML